MYGTYSALWHSEPSMNDPKADAFTYHSQTPVYLGGDAGTERVVLYTSNTGSKAKAEIQKYDPLVKGWVVEYTKEAEGVPFFYVSSGYWEMLRKYAAVLYTVSEGGGILTYTVISRKQDKLVESLSRHDICNGGVWLEEGKLIESHGLRYFLWVSKHRHPVLVPYMVPRIPGAVLIDFSISPDGNVRIRKNKYSVSPGTIVQILRTDMNNVSESLLFSYTPIISYIEHRNAFRLTQSGKVELTIIPGRYNWNKAVSITVTAQ